MRYKRRYERVTKGVELTRATCDFCGGPDVPNNFWDRTEIEMLMLTDMAVALNGGSYEKILKYADNAEDNPEGAK